MFVRLLPGARELPMRWLIAFSLIAGLAGSAQALNNRQMYYWEDDNPAPGLSWEAVPPRMARYGWSDTPQGLRISGPLRQAPNERLWSYCARQVGRAVRIDNDTLVVSTAMTDACVRNGGRM
jgi:hypothetical protein